MIRKFILGLIAVATVAIPVTLAAAPANAHHNHGEGDTRPCVTRGEWESVHRGMSKVRVHDMFDTAGWHESGSSWSGMVDIYRGYRSCPGFGGDLSINFDNYSSNQSGMRLYSKSRYRSW